MDPASRGATHRPRIEGSPRTRGHCSQAGRLNSHLFTDNFSPPPISLVPQSPTWDPGGGEGVIASHPKWGGVSQVFKEAPAKRCSHRNDMGQAPPLLLSVPRCWASPTSFDLGPTELGPAVRSPAVPPQAGSPALGTHSVSPYHSLDLASCLPGCGSNIPRDPGGGSEGET